MDSLFDVPMLPPVWLHVTTLQLFFYGTGTCKKTLFGAEKVADHLCGMFQAHVILSAGILAARTLRR